MFKVEELAPEFELRGYFKNEEKKYKLSDHRGKWVALFWYHDNRTSVCHSEVDAIEKLHHEFTDRGTEVLAGSKSSIENHKGWLEELGGLSFPLLSDPDGSIAAKYGVLMKKELGLLRGTFLIDHDGILRYAQVGMPKVGRNIEEIIRVLAALQSGEACEVGWEPKR